LSHNKLENYYHTIFSMAQHHKYSITELENMIPFEKDIYVNMLLKHLDDERKEQEKGNLF
tara:strand:- start:2191 stop:2370 length:180 start_codon:yes stop_codon:yes gene_type:complete